LRAGRFRPVAAALLVAAVGAVVVLAGAGLAVGGCAGRGTGTPAPAPGPVAPAPQPGPGSPSLLKGISLSPRSFEPADFTDFFVKAGEAGQIVTWAGDWNELGNLVSGAPRVLMELAPGYGLLPVIQAQFFSQSTGRLLRPLTAKTRKDYNGCAAAFAREFKPPYLGLGIEVNLLHEKAPADFDAFVALFGEVYDAVKAESPETKVFTVFQLERMKGLGGGLFGGENDPAAAQWALLDRFPKLDLVAFTTYPGLIYKSPADIPADYYSDIRGHTHRSPWPSPRSAGPAALSPPAGRAARPSRPSSRAGSSSLRRRAGWRWPSGASCMTCGRRCPSIGWACAAATARRGRRGTSGRSDGWPYDGPPLRGGGQCGRHFPRLHTPAPRLCRPHAFDRPWPACCERPRPMVNRWP